MATVYTSREVQNITDDFACAHFRIEFAEVTYSWGTRYYVPTTLDVRHDAMHLYYSSDRLNGIFALYFRLYWLKQHCGAPIHLADWLSKESTYTLQWLNSMDDGDLEDCILDVWFQENEKDS